MTDTMNVVESSFAGWLYRPYIDLGEWRAHGDPITILRVTLSGRDLTLPAIRGADYAGLGSVTEITFRPGEERPQVTYLTVPWTQPMRTADCGVRNRDERTESAASEG